jgi:hypothetical protein
MQLSTLNFGIFLVYWIDFAFSSYIEGFAWRVPVILQCVFLFGMIALCGVVPETPRWLAAHDMPDESLEVLRRLKSHALDDTQIQEIHTDILRAVDLETSLGVGLWKDLLKNDGVQSQRRLVIACAIQIFQQLGGINAIICKAKFRSTLFLSRDG